MEDGGGGGGGHHTTINIQVRTVRSSRISDAVSSRTRRAGTARATVAGEDENVEDDCNIISRE